MIRVGDRVTVTDRGDAHHGENGTVMLGEHPGLLTGRTIVEVLVDGQPELFDIGYYVEQLDVLSAVAT